MCSRTSSTALLNTDFITENTVNSVIPLFLKISLFPLFLKIPFGFAREMKSRHCEFEMSIELTSAAEWSSVHVVAFFLGRFGSIFKRHSTWGYKKTDGYFQIVTVTGNINDMISFVIQVSSHRLNN